jgi:hypothetical protein
MGGVFRGDWFGYFAVICEYYYYKHTQYFVYLRLKSNLKSVALPLLHRQSQYFKFEIRSLAEYLDLKNVKNMNDLLRKNNDQPTKLL